MGDTLDRMMYKGWKQMSKSLDDNIPVGGISHFHKFKYYYSAAIVFLFIIFSAVWLNDGGVLMHNRLVLNHKVKAKEGKNIVNINNSNELIIPYIKKNNSFAVDNYFKSSIFNIENHLVSENEYLQKQQKETVGMYGNFDRSIEFLPVNKHPKLENSADPLSNKLVLEIDQKRNSDLVNENPKEELALNEFKHNTVSISFNSINEDFKSFGGIDGGINYAYKINKNIGFMTGIEHSLFSRDKMEYDLNNLQKAVSGEFIEDNRTLIYGQEQDLNSSQERLYYVGIPLGFLYSIDKFTISAGVKFSYLISATDFSGSASPENQRVMASIREVAPEVSESYNKFNYSFIFGFEFHVLKDFSIFSRFNYAYSNIVNSYSYNENEIGDLFIVSGFENNYREKLDKNIYFGLGIKYDLAKK